MTLTRLLIGVLILTSSLAHAQRLVSVGGGLTEIVYALDRETLLAGVDTTSTFPEAATQLPQVGYQRALSAEGILALQPDLLLVTTEAGPPGVISLLEDSGVRLMRLDADYSLDGLYQRIRAIARALSAQEQGEQLIDQLVIDADALAIQRSQSSAPRVLFLLSHAGRSPMVAGHGTAANAIIQLAGATNVVADADGYVPLNQEAMATLAPDIIITTRQGLDALGGKPALLALPGIRLTPAAHHDRIVVMDALYMLGFGPRTPAAASSLHTALQDAMRNDR